MKPALLTQIRSNSFKFAECIFANAPAVQQYTQIRQIFTRSHQCNKHIQLAGQSDTVIASARYNTLISRENNAKSGDQHIYVEPGNNVVNGDICTLYARRSTRAVGLADAVQGFGNLIIQSKKHLGALMLGGIWALTLWLPAGGDDGSFPQTAAESMLWHAASQSEWNGDRAEKIYVGKLPLSREEWYSIALQKYEELMNRYPKDRMFVLESKARIYDKLGHFDDALKYLNQASCGASCGRGKYREYLALKSRILIHLGRLEEARTYLIKAIEVRFPSDEDKLDLVDLLIKMNRRDEAIHILNELPNLSGDWLLQRAKAWEKLGEINKAKLDYKKKEKEEEDANKLEKELEKNHIIDR